MGFFFDFVAFAIRGSPFHPLCAREAGLDRNYLTHLERACKAKTGGSLKRELETKGPRGSFFSRANPRWLFSLQSL